MKILPSLDRRDRNALLACLGLVVVIIVAIAALAPRQQDDSPVPSSYGVGTHGAKAAYLLLLRSGYRVERWERPLAELDSTGVDEHTVLVLARPFLIDEKEAKAAIKNVLAHGGRVVATGGAGSYLLPNGEAHGNSAQIASTTCHAKPDGLDPLASSGDVYMEAPVVWTPVEPSQHAQYNCGKGAIVVTYAVGKGQVVWWASSGPLENVSLLRGGNLDLLLNSIGSGVPGEKRIVWDESLHGDVRSLSSYTAGTPVRLMWLQAVLIALLLLLSLGRRSGPLRAFAETPRTTPVEFIESLGALYERASASNTAVAIAYERFRHQLERRGGFAPAETQLAAPELAAAIRTRLHYNHPELTADLAACEGASYGELSRRRALELVQALHDHSERLGLLGGGLSSIAANSSAATEPEKIASLQGRA
jgi:hypothetical protein